ncbi:P-loop containing nucleoside triphosphate hydrolase protein [Nemania sp. NC0429]|nr:P-loop containing nucleoside triphosphate hydrolase protein [Nemania sp. NC0429]
MSTPPAAKLIIQMSGAPGSGKSTIARLLRPHINGVVIDHDVLRSSLLVSSAASTPSAFDHAAKQAYELQWALAGDLMRQGVDAVIIDSACNYAALLERGSSLAAEHGYRYWYVECRVGDGDVDLLDRRLRARPAMPSQRSAVDGPPAAAAAARGDGSRVGEDEDARALFARWMRSPCRPDGGRLIAVDSTARPETVRDEILARMAVE